MKRSLLIAIAGLAALATWGGAALGSGGDPAVDRALATARSATARFHDVEAAEAAGYVRVSECETEPGLGAMGFHYLNPAYAADDSIKITKPEILVYAPKSDGRLRLVAIEYFKADADQDPATDSDRPTFAGVPFDGPMEGHSEGMPVHYDLHAWVWAHNPVGAFEQYNPNLAR
ncbi:MAG: hypothetical protein ACRDPC_02995 [Solirubrobacteraceae bacterium]